MTWEQWWSELLQNFGLTPQQAVLLVFGIAALFAALAVSLVIAGALISPKGFGQSCSTTMGMFAGMGAAAAAVVVVCVACLCAVVGMVAFVVAGR